MLLMLLKSSSSQLPKKLRQSTTKEPEASSLKTSKNKSDNQSDVALPSGNDITFLSSVKTNEPSSAYIVTISKGFFQWVSSHAVVEKVCDSPLRSPQQPAKYAKDPVKKVSFQETADFPTPSSASSSILLQLPQLDLLSSRVINVEQTLASCDTKLYHLAAKGFHDFTRSLGDAKK